LHWEKNPLRILHENVDKIIEDPQLKKEFTIPELPAVCSLLISKLKLGNGTSQYTVDSDNVKQWSKVLSSFWDLLYKEILFQKANGRWKAKKPNNIHRAVSFIQSLVCLYPIFVHLASLPDLEEVFNQAGMFSVFLSSIAY